MSDDLDDLDLDDLGLDDEPEEDGPDLIDRALPFVAARAEFSAGTLRKGLNITSAEAEALCQRLHEEGYAGPKNGQNRHVTRAKARKRQKELEKTHGKGDAETRQAVRGLSDSMVSMYLHRPVSIGFLAQVFKMERRTVVKRLGDLPPVDYHMGNQPLYSFRQACAYVIPPRVNMREYIQKAGTDDLPESLRKDVWDARLKEQTWRQRAGELWPTEDVLEVLGEAFQRLKTTTQLWVDQITDDQGLSAEVREELMQRVDGLQADLHKTLVEMPQEKATPSLLAEVSDDA